jgi:FKBP-type peptidyl-prolyl cis-trans isomerase
MMKNSYLLGAVLAAAQTFVVAQDAAAPAAKPAEAAAPAAAPAAADEDPMKSVPMDKVSYYIGLDFGKKMNGQPFTLNFEELIAGIKNGASGEKAKYAEADAQEVMGKFQAALQAADAKLAEKAAQAGKDFLVANGKKPGVTTTASGLQYEVMKAAEGPKPAATDTVKVHYHGTLTSGKVFDSSVERGEPIEFGLNQVIKGWTEGVQLMPKGSKYKFTIPSELAYGEGGQGSIPPNSVLIFEVELLDFKSM